MTNQIYLITGPAGSGKTSMAEQLAELGYQTVDTDSATGLCYFVNKNNKPVPYPAGADASWWENHNYVWEIDRLKILLNKMLSGKTPIFVCGNAGNIKQAWDIFDAVYYLDIPFEMIPDRVAAETAGNSFGLRVDERAQLSRWAEAFKAKMVDAGAVMVDATAPVDAVAKDILTKLKQGATA